MRREDDTHAVRACWRDRRAKLQVWRDTLTRTHQGLSSVRREGEPHAPCTEPLPRAEKDEKALLRDAMRDMWSQMEGEEIAQ